MKSMPTTPIRARKYFDIIDLINELPLRINFHKYRRLR